MDDLLVDDVATIREGHCVGCFTFGQVMTRKLLGAPFTSCVDRTACFKRRMARIKVDTEKRQRGISERDGLKILRSIRAALATEEGSRLVAEIIAEIKKESR